MNQRIDLAELLTDTEPVDRRRASFALLTLGVAESLSAGALTATDAVRNFFNADNCLYVAHDLGDETADEIMSRGVQLSDLVEALPDDLATQQFLSELAMIRAECLALLKDRPLAA